MALAAAMNEEKMARYIALIRKDADTAYGVDFPDLPGIATGGDTLDEALGSAREALALHLDSLARHGDPVPPPSTMEKIMSRRASRGAVAVFVEAPEPRGRSKRVNIMVDENLLRRIDKASNNRSAFLDAAARAELSRRGA